MPEATRIPVNPQMLRWAREEAGMTLEEAAERAGIRAPEVSTSMQDPGDLLGKMESGEIPLDMGNFRALARLYCRPEISFFLSRPPQKKGFVADFRKGQGKGAKRESPEFAALKRRLSSLHGILGEIADLNGSPRLSLVGSVRPSDSVSSMVERMHALWGDPRKGRMLTAGEFFSQLRKRIQDAGVYVVLVESLDFEHAPFAVWEFASICLADERAALMVLNANDTVENRTFFLIHGFCHILLGKSGVFDHAGVLETGCETDEEKLCCCAACSYLLSEDHPNAHTEGLLRPGSSAACLVASAQLSEQEYKTRAGTCLKSVYERQTRDAFPESCEALRAKFGDRLLQTLWEAACDGQIAYTDVSSLLGISVARLESMCTP